MKRETKLRNIIFPVWMMYSPFGLFFPIFWAIALAGNFVWDTAVLLLAFWWLHLPGKKGLYKRAIVRVWLCGFLADVVASLPMLLAMLCELDYADHIYGAAPIDLLYIFPFVVLGGGLVYLFDRKYALARTGLDAGTIHRIALALAVLTAPYTFLIPLDWIY